jgi:bis(5'-nucleosyl)-tetraphosphatase (symmetrical)
MTRRKPNMATYAIGDIQGCFDELQQLLHIIHFDTKHDTLWLVGDLVNRGPKSLEVLRFIKQLKNTVAVLGNHDIHLLATFNNKDPYHITHNLEAIFEAPDGRELIDWLRFRPLIHHDHQLDYVMVHAGIYPYWNLEQAKQYAHEAEEMLRSDNYIDFLEYLYGNEPNVWKNTLTGIERQRFIINSFVRMRFCNREGTLDFTETGKVHSSPKNYLPWFAIPNRATTSNRIIFGHWAALRGKTNTENVIGLDTGCVWGGNLTAFRLDDSQRFST